MTEKTLHNSDASGATKNVPDIQFFGDGDMWSLLSKASSQKEGWMKSTKAMQTFCGCLVQVSTQQRNADGSYSLAEAIAFVPGVVVHEVRDEDEKIVSRHLDLGGPLTAGIAQGVALGAPTPIAGQSQFEHKAYGLRADGSIGEEMTEMRGATKLGD